VAECPGALAVGTAMAMGSEDRSKVNLVVGIVSLGLGRACKLSVGAVFWLLTGSAGPGGVVASRELGNVSISL
jgi:hypothetical protein